MFELRWWYKDGYAVHDLSSDFAALLRTAYGRQGRGYIRDASGVIVILH